MQAPQNAFRSLQGSLVETKPAWYFPHPAPHLLATPHRAVGPGKRRGAEPSFQQACARNPEELSCLRILGMADLGRGSAPSGRAFVV